MSFCHVIVFKGAQRYELVQKMDMLFAFEIDISWKLITIYFKAKVKFFTQI